MSDEHTTPTQDGHVSSGPENPISAAIPTTEQPASPHKDIQQQLPNSDVDIEGTIGKINSIPESGSAHEGTGEEDTTVNDNVHSPPKTEIQDDSLEDTEEDFNIVPRALDSSPLDLQFSKTIAIQLEAQGFSPTQEYIDQLTDLSIAYFNKLIVSLRNFTELQRRHQPSISDTKTAFRLQGVHPTGLYDEVEASRKVGKSARMKLNEVEAKTRKLVKQLETFDSHIDPTSESLAFFANEQYEIAELVPKQSERPNYIPSFLPDLPPDYTYQNTPKFMETLTDLKQLRMRLVEESRLTEKSLYGLIDDDEIQWRKKFEKELDSMQDSDESDEISVMSDSGKIDTPFEEVHEPAVAEKTVKVGETAENPQVIDKEPKKDARFDFIEYAQSRKRIREKREQAIQKKIELRQSNIFIKAEKYYSPYATEKVTPEVDAYFKNILHEEFKTVIKSVRLAETKKKRKIEEILQEKAKKQKALEDERAKSEFGFNFNHKESSDEEDDDDDHELFPQFDFDPPAEESGIRIENEDNNINNNNNNNNNNDIVKAESEPVADIAEEVHEPEAQVQQQPEQLVSSEPLFDESSDEDFLQAELEDAMASVENEPEPPQPQSQPQSVPPQENNLVVPESDSDEDEFDFEDV